MNEPQTPREPNRQEDPRQIPKWARTCAQNRSLPFILSLLIFLGLFAAIAGPSWLAGYAYHKGYTVLFAACLVELVLAVAALVYFSVPWWGGKRMEQLATRLYAKEGTVTPVSAHGVKSKRWRFALGLGFGGCIIASVVLGLLGYLPDRYMQPVSALYVVPFLVILAFWIRPAGWPVMLLWPALYALHAIAVVAGAPIQFTGAWESLNMQIPTVGYGLLTGLIAHLYSRFALHKLKKLARMDLPVPDGQGEGPRS